VARLIEAMRKAVSVPVTVKLRTGWSEGKQNISTLAQACEEAGASAIVIHGRTREQRYSRAADWDVIGRVAAERTVPVVGNGDILTHFEARARMEQAGVDSLMLARGALIKPWLFREIREGRSWLPTAEERLALIWRFVELLRDHFGVSEKGGERMLRFLPWHLNFFCRYRPFPEAEFAEQARRHPLIQTRPPAETGLPPLETLLRDSRPETHERLSRELLASRSREEALERTLRLQSEVPAETGEHDLTLATSQIAG
jgi:tRNA-dihydrouridine synthase 3